MKRTIALILTAVFLSILCNPCAAADTGRAYSGFADVAEESVSYDAIRFCYETGLMNGVSETKFNPQGKLNIAQLVVLAARLYNLQNGGNGSVPELPDLNQPYLRFYDSEGNLFASFSSAEELHAYNSFPEHPYISLSDASDGTALPETCKLEIGFEGYNRVQVFQGVKESHESAGGTMHQGFVGTGYRFTDPGAGRFTTLPSASLAEQLKGAWWFPAAFYLASEGVMDIEGELFYRASGGNQYDGYNPLIRFSRDNASRALFAWLVDLAAGELPILNPNAQLPADVNPELTLENADAVLRLYQAGILTGVDKAGNFNGSGELTRGQAAIMLNRVLDSNARVKMT